MTLHEKSPPIPETVFRPLPFPFNFHPLCPCICLFSSRTETHIYILHFCASRCESCDPPPLFSHHKERAPPLEKRRQARVSASFFRFVPLSTALSPFSCFSHAFCLIRFSPTHHHQYY